LRGKIKVNKKTGVGVGQPGDGKDVTLSRDKNEIKVETDIAFSKRYKPGAFNINNMYVYIYLTLSMPILY